MKQIMKKLSIPVMVLLMVMVPAGLFAQTQDIENMENTFTKFTNDAAAALPMNSLVGTDWSDAYIGQLLGVPPHFGVGVTVGATAVPTDGIEKVMESYGVSVPSALDKGFAAFGGVPFPAAVLNGRIGGVVLPFDIGFKLGMTPPGGIHVVDYSFDYLLAGFDFRYAVLEGGAILPKVSVGAGLNYLSGSMAVGSMSDIVLYGIEKGGSSYTVAFDDPKLEFGWETLTVDTKAQVSKSFFVVTPYAGVGLTVPVSSTAGGGFTGTVQAYEDGEKVSMDDFRKAAEAANYNVDVDNKGFTILSNTGMMVVPRVYGGASLNMMVVKLDVGVKYNLYDMSMGVDIGTRVQL